MLRMAGALLGATVLVLAASPVLATFPYPAPPPGTPPQDYAAYLRLPTVLPPVRPVDFTGGTEWKLTSDQTGDPSIDFGYGDAEDVRSAIPRSTRTPPSSSACAG